MARYRTTLRPAGFATLPPGLKYTFVEAPQGEHWTNFTHLVASCYRYGVFEADRELTAEEMRQFDIERVDAPEAYSIVHRNEKWGHRFDVYKDGQLLTTSENRADAEGFIAWHQARDTDDRHLLDGVREG